MATCDQNLPQSLIDSYGHADVRIFARVVTGGDIHPGDKIGVLILNGWLIERLVSIAVRVWHDPLNLGFFLRALLLF